MKNKQSAENYNYYSFFIKYSLMENYGFTAGFVSRIFEKFIPSVPDVNTFEFYLKKELERGNISNMRFNLTKLLSEPSTTARIKNDLNHAISALTSKIVTFGFDHKFHTKFKKLNIDSNCYKILLYQSSLLSEEGKVTNKEFETNLNEVCLTIYKLRENKNIIGTSLHLTIVMKNLLHYVERIKLLLDLKSDINSEKKWAYLIADYFEHEKSKNSLSKFFVSHTDLLALEIVEHTAQKGEKYVANDHKEYILFFKKGLLGGFIIAIFAFFKILLDTEISSAIPRAFLYSINYSICFIVVFLLGGIIATKQPAMTASTIAKHIDKDDDLQVDSLQAIILLVRKIARSQFISLIGNFIMALLVSCILAFLLTLLNDINPINTMKSKKLIYQVFPFSGGAFFYAAIAGIFLSLSGFISGYFDNKVKAINLASRITHNKTMSRNFSELNRKKIAYIVDKNLGVYAGNISLGFFLGSAFLISYILPINIDIRHIAFSSANVGFAILNHTFAFSTIILALLSVLFIGFINFIVSFSLTLYLVLKSRGVKINGLGQLLKLSVKDILSNPLDYLMYRKDK
ncbi:hypothetical protein [Bizionia sp.]|uniref:hypothetical protein n=1 Tax=Bizionia sp. TaxID=1954480 RepID=UPI003A9368A8